MNQFVVISAPGMVEIGAGTVPIPQTGEALLKMLYGGICGSDLNSFRGTSPYVSYPRIPGHEFSAEIVEVGENCYGLKKGMLVTANPYFNCTHCYSCARGLVNCCTTNQTMGVQREGSFSQYITMPVDRIYQSGGLNAKTLALMEPFCIAYHGVKRAAPKSGEQVLVVGAGTIGIFAAVAAKMLGATVSICDISEEKISYAERLGVDHTFLNLNPAQFSEETGRLTNGNGFDVTIEAVGLPTTFQGCIDAVAFGGRVVLIGVGNSTLDFNFTIIQKKELHIFGSRNAVKEDFIQAIELVKNTQFDLAQVVTDEYSMENASQAFADFSSNPGHMLKILLKF